MPFLVDVEEGQLALQRRVLVAAAGDEDVRPGLPGQPQQFGGAAVGDHPGVRAEQLADLVHIATGALGGPRGGYLHPDVLKGRDHRPALDPAGVQHRLRAAEPFPLRGRGGRGGGLLGGDELLGATGQAVAAEYPGEAAQGVAHRPMP